MTPESRPSPQRRKLLIVEDDLGLQKQLRWCFDSMDVCLAGDRSEAIAELRRHEPAVVLQDLGLPPDAEGVSEGMATLQDILRLAPHTKVIVVTGNDDRQNAVSAIASGAWDFYQKPLDVPLLSLLVERAFRIHALEADNRALYQQSTRSALAGVIANGEPMRKVCRIVEKVAPTSASVLLLGESGTGKELLARALHQGSARASNPFVAINCAAIPETLLESELFGYERGAFTGATRQTPGKIECANGGTLFLDEIGDMTVSLQAKLLRFLQERVIERLGGRTPIPVDVRVVCATHQALDDMIVRGTFRQDLYYRLAEVVIRIPPLRDRGDDTLIIAQHLLDDRARRHGKRIRGFTPDAIAALQTYTWPGNIRELENKLNGAVILAEGALLTPADLGLATGGDSTPDFLNLRAVRARAERAALEKALALTSHNLSKAAEMLGIARPTLYDLLERHGLDDEGVRAEE